MSGLTNILQETHRRAIWQVMGTYVAAAWVVLQVVEVLMETIGLPDWVPRLALILLAIGLPVVIATAVIQGAARSLAARRKASSEASDGSSPAEEGSPPVEKEQEEDAGVSAPPSASSGSLFTWRNVAFGGIGAFALLGVLTAGWMAMRSLGIGPVGSLVASGVLEKGEQIILADFAGDSTVSTAATLALRVDLDESSLVSIADPTFIGSTLERMQRPPDSKLTQELAREVAVRAGIKAIVAGEITRLGESYILTARLLAADSGEQLASLRQDADDSGDILDAIDGLSRELRERLGESLKTIHSSEPLADVTTASLEALQKYSQAWDAINLGNDDQGRALLTEAIALDSTFAMAWRKLATRTLGERRIEAATKAYEYRDRLTDRERYLTLGLYHMYVTEDLAQATTAYRTLLDTYPNDAVALNNLGVAYTQRDEAALATEMYQRAMIVDPLSAQYPRNLVPLLFLQGEPDSAGRVLDRFTQNLPDNPELPVMQFGYATATKRYDEARPILARLLATEDLDRLWEARFQEAWLTLLEGRISDAERIWDQLATDDEEEDRLERKLERAIEIQLRVAGDTATAIRDGLAALEEHDIHALSAPDWPIEDLLFLFADAGRPDLIEEMIGEWVEEMVQLDPSLAGALEPLADSYLDARVLIANGDPLGVGRMREAVDLATEGNNCDDLCGAFWMATAFDLTAQSDSAARRYEQYLSTVKWNRLEEDAQHLHRVYLRLGQIYDATGDVESAKRYYGRFEELWRDADPRLQPQVETVRTRLAELIEVPTASDGSGS